MTTENTKPINNEDEFGEDLNDADVHIQSKGQLKPGLTYPMLCVGLVDHGRCVFIKDGKKEITKKMTWLFVSEDGNQFLFSFNPILNDKSSLYKALMQMTGLKPTGDYNPTVLVGQTVGVKLTKTDKDKMKIMSFDVIDSKISLPANCRYVIWNWLRNTGEYFKRRILSGVTLVSEETFRKELAERKAKKDANQPAAQSTEAVAAAVPPSKTPREDDPGVEW